jgi:hypothetical protein
MDLVIYYIVHPNNQYPNFRYLKIQKNPPPMGRAAWGTRRPPERESHARSTLFPLGGEVGLLEKAGDLIRRIPETY